MARNEVKKTILPKYVIKGILRIFDFIKHWLFTGKNLAQRTAVPNAVSLLSAKVPSTVSRIKGS